MLLAAKIFGNKISLIPNILRLPWGFHSEEVIQAKGWKEFFNFRKITPLSHSPQWLPQNKTQSKGASGLSEKEFLTSGNRISAFAFWQ